MKRLSCFEKIITGINSGRLNLTPGEKKFYDMKVVIEKLNWERNLVDGYQLYAYNSSKNQLLLSILYDSNLDKYDLEFDCENAAITAIEVNDFNLLKRLVVTLKYPINYCDELGNTLLYNAVIQNRIKIAEFLIEHGVSEYANKEGLKPTDLFDIYDVDNEFHELFYCMQ